MKKAVFLLLFLTLVSLGSAQMDGEGILVTGSGTVYGEPDLAVLDLGVNIVNDDLAAASDEANEAIRSIIEALTEAGVAENDIRTAYYNIWREERFGPEGGATETPQYRVTNTLIVTVREVERAGELLSLSLSAGANTVGGIQYTFANPEELAGEARELAMKNARAKAEQFADLGGVTLGPVLMITDMPNNQTPGFPAAARFEAAQSDVPVSGGQLAVSTSVQVRFALGE